MISTASKVYRFGADGVDGDGTMRELLGGKGAGLAEMTALGVPVPPGFTISTEVCRQYIRSGELTAEQFGEIELGLKWLEEQTGKRFGDRNDPLLVSVRSGAPVSMPGMMDTILNVGLNDVSVVGLAAKSGSESFAYDLYKRLLHMFGMVVLGVPKSEFEHTSFDGHGSQDPAAGKDVGSLRLGIEASKKQIEQHTGKPFPQDARAQLRQAVEAVFRSWNSDRAIFYRKLNNIPESMGTAVTVQADGLWQSGAG